MPASNSRDVENAPDDTTKPYTNAMQPMAPANAASTALDTPQTLNAHPMRQA